MWLLVFAKVCCGNACHPVTAISVVAKLGTTHAVWMPGLDVPWCGPGVGRSARAETYVNHREVPMIAVTRSSDLFSLKYYQYIFRIHLARLVEVFNDVHSFRDPIV